MSKRYVVCWPNEYTDRDGVARTDFMRVGTAFPMRDRDGFNIELAISPPAAEVCKPTRLVLFAANNQQDNQRQDSRDQRNSNRNNNNNRRGYER